MSCRCYREDCKYNCDGWCDTIPTIAYSRECDDYQEKEEDED